MQQLKIAQMIDHTNLKPDATEADIIKLCEEAVQHKFGAVCVNSHWVHCCYHLLDGSDIPVCSVVGFPLGASVRYAKAHEADVANEMGADEIDMVMNIGAAKSGQWNTVQEDIMAVRNAVPDAILKVILECCLLTDDEKYRACKVAEGCGVDFVKTSTGFSTGGATIEDVRLMRRYVKPEIGIKAAGRIRTLDDALRMVDAGANRLGCSSSVSIMEELKKLHSIVH
ncbi:deoxyribose-phosphate aldolase [Candidatus Peregrinibacteria bacterium CG22_combo_CG10-13_8_21_14_all_49_11]|nr:MAG: deoxyribose-phosphate aldolase [Candidatus Peregrinibacteria bacterium CG22_combo_CG10-13_8_21_14_all_49_11]